MRVLVACEFSGTVRDAFAARGHDAWSCDLRPSETTGNHIQGDAIDAAYSGQWDLMIGHPPCNYISYAGTQAWDKPGRVWKRLDALRFFAKLWDAPIPRICLENPKSCASPVIAKYSQEIQPYYFGDPQMKTTWLWLKNLPKLEYSMHETLFGNVTATAKPEPLSFDSTGKARHFTDSKVRDPKERARFWPSIANAMADQWGKLPAIQLAA